MSIDEILAEAIKEKNNIKIISILTTIICNDPLFMTTKFEDSLNDINMKCGDIRVKYEKQIDEFELEPKEWTKNYFYRQVEWLRRNFTPEKRIPHIKDVGKAVFKEEFREDFKEKTQNASMGKKSVRSQVLKPLAIVVLVIIVVVLILKMIK